MQVHQTSPAPASTGLWVRRLLEPAAIAAGIRNPPPVELRPTKYGGYCSFSEIDRRVAINNNITLMRKTQFVRVYTHEVVHRLLEEAGAVGELHGPRFFALQLYLFAKLDMAGYMSSERHSTWMSYADLYDIQDAPIGYEDKPTQSWLGASIDWAHGIASQLMERDLCAEEAAKFICEQYPVFCERLQRRANELPALRSEVLQLRERVAQTAERWRSLNLQTMFAGLAGWLLVAVAVWAKLCS